MISLPKREAMTAKIRVEMEFDKEMSEDIKAAATDDKFPKTMIWKVRYNQSQQYHEMIINSYKRLVEDKYPQESMPLFVLACAAGLEYFLNFMYLAHCTKIYGFDKYRLYAESYHSMSFMAKLKLIVPTITKSDYILNPDTETKHNLFKIISVRNTIVHGYDSIKNSEYIFKHFDNPKVGGELIGEKYEKATKDHIIKITKKMCDDFYEAMKLFTEELFFASNQSKLKQTSLIIERPKPKFVAWAQKEDPKAT